MTSQKWEQHVKSYCDSRRSYKESLKVEVEVVRSCEGGSEPKKKLKIPLNSYSDVLIVP